MKILNSVTLIVVVALAAGTSLAVADSSEAQNTFTLQNEKIKCTVTVDKDNLVSDRLEIRKEWAERFGATSPIVVETDADFAVDVMYTDWSAPGKANNADNPAIFTKKDFRFVNQSMTETPKKKELTLYFKGRETSLELMIKYSLEPNAFYARRTIAVMDTAFGHHFLRWIWVRSGNVGGVNSVIKAGGFGQPVAVRVRHGGAFFGLEYPTSQNSIETMHNGNGVVRCGEEFGQIISKDWIESEPVVEAVTPNEFIKDWFFHYVDDIRVVPLRPFTLYNSWYDLRSPEYPKVTSDHWMSEENAMKMAALLRNNMIEKHNIALDAFVLDDGWDIYQSDWVLRKQEWPHGLKPLSEELKKTNTALGIWLGPTGGYSFRMKRVNWMKEHGYEVVGKSRDNAMLCLAGTNYSELFKKRITDFVVNDGVGYFKWDGIQFSCSEPNHGHAVDIYSRRAVMQSVIDKCQSVREKNPNIFLNITSGTWLSPWWVKYANTIWMQGADYGYSDVPSIGMRDGAITYRDFILYDDFKNLDLWFPIANLMTHGIIKGKLELLGSPEEPLDKFTDDALLYFARGISMYELYISPDILSEGEWNTLSTSITWAKDRFPILTSSTVMIGGNPMKREPYGYVHFKGKKGIIAARNPFITSGKLAVEFSPDNGLDPAASKLVVEKVYPTHWIDPHLYKAGERFVIPLDGYETAIYETYPVEEATVPLLAGVTFDILSKKASEYSINYYNASSGAKILNPQTIKSMSTHGKNINLKTFTFSSERTSFVVRNPSVNPSRDKKSVLHATFDLADDSRDATIAVLLTPDTTMTMKKKPSLSVLMNGKPTTAHTENQEGKSQWYTVDVVPGSHEMSFEVKLGDAERQWKGKAFVWLITQQPQKSHEVSFVLQHETDVRPLPPHPWRAGELRNTIKLGESVMSVSE